MLRGAFIRADGLVIPNNITVVGSALILAGFARHQVIPFAVALVNCVPDPLLIEAQLNEPSAANGYARIAVTQDAAGWPVAATLNGESYVETDYMTWAAIGGAFDKPVNRLALMSGSQVIALSSAFPNEITIDPTTPELNRKYKYRVYLR